MSDKTHYNRIPRAEQNTNPHTDRTYDCSPLYPWSVFHTGSHQSGSSVPHKFCRLYHCLSAGNEIRHCQRSALSLSGYRRASCIFRVRRRPGKTCRSHRRIPDRVPFCGADPGISDGTFSGKKAGDIAGMVSGLAVCYAFGTLWLAWQLHLTPAAALTAGVIPYLPGDAVKIIFAAVVGPKLKARIGKV